MSRLTEQLKQSFEKYRDKVAVIESFSGRSISYGELDILSGKIAQKLRAEGVGKGDIVPILLPRGFAYIAAEIGAIKAGCAYAPLLGEYPAERIDYICQDCGARFVADESFVRSAAELEPLTEYVESAEKDRVLLIYTSGSTGNPKGVIHTHRSFYEGVRRNILNNVMSENDKTLGIINFSFALSVGEVYDTLLSGASLFLLSNEERADIRFVKSAVIENHITALYINPNMLKRLDLRGSSLRVAQTVGERLSGFYSDEYRIINIYGASETLCALAFEPDKAYDNTPVGKPVDSFRAYIVDENGNEAPDGEEGEICVAGALCDGYLNLDEQTSAVFSPNPFSDDEGFEMMYHTNDIGKKLPDGNIVYVNRKDWMVKVNGQRVETGEIEVRMAADVDAVEAAVVKAFENEYGMTYLAAYYQVKKGMSATAEEIEGALRKRLPDYMIPRFFTQMERFPLNANGKIDRRAILPPQAASFKAAYAAPENETEEMLCEAFMRILHCGQVGVHDDFFALGGDSLLAMNLQLACDSEELSTEMIFAGKTPRRIAQLLAAASKSKPVSAERPAEYPLNPFERGMYMEQKISPESTMYTLVGCYMISGTTADNIKSALEDTFRAHEAFRSVYREKDGNIFRVLVDDIPSVRIEKTEHIQECFEAAKAQCHSFDLTKGIPAEAIIYTDGEVCLTAFLFHHILFDGGSDGIFARELLARLSGDAVLEDSYDLSAASQEDTESVYRRGLEKYREMFGDGVPAADLPLKKTRPEVHPLSDVNHAFVLDGEALKNLRQAAGEKKTTVFHILLAALSVTIAKYTASEDVVVGVPVNTRNRYTQNTIGMFVNTAPLRLHPACDKNADDYLREVGDTVSAFIKENSCPYDRLVAGFLKERDNSRNPLFDVGINYLPVCTQYEKDNICIRTSYVLQPSGKDINVVMQVQDDQISGFVQYSSELFEERIIRNFTEQFVSAAAAFCGECGTLSEASALPLTQKKELEAFAVAAKADVPVKLLHQMLEVQADKLPGKTALIACDKTLTFAQLESEANRVANALMAEGFRKGDSAVVMLRRTSRFFAAVFGVLKAGGAFIPTDPGYPAERIHSVFQDSGARFVITDGAEAEYENALPVDRLLECGDDARPEIEVSPHDLAYMIYTSGSTGKPKGVMLRHIGICSYLTPHEANIHMHYVDKNVSTYLSVTTVAFDMSFKEHTAALCNGKTLVFASDEEMNNPKLLAKLMDQYGVDCMNATPSRLQEENAPAAEQREAYPLSSNQLGVYYEVMKNPGELLYNMPVCCCFDSIDADRLQKALCTAIKCHSYMNTHIEIQNGNPVQVRSDSVSPEIPVVEMTAEELENRKNEFVRPFDLHADVLYRFEIIRSEEKTYLLSDIHHIIFDGLSRGVLMDTVSRAYMGEATAAEPFTYLEYALQEERNRESDSYRESETYFSDMLRTFETVSEIPPDKKGRPEDGGIGMVEVPVERGAVDAFCRQNAVTPSSLFLAATFYVVSRFANSKNIYISTISGGRSNSRIRGTVGMFVRTLPLHMDFAQDLSAGALIQKSGRAMLDSIEHEAYPFMQLADKFGYSTEIMYECQLGVGSAARVVEGAEYTQQFLKLEKPKCKVTVSVEDRAEGIAVSIRYNDAVYTEEYMRTFALSVRTAAQRMMENTQQPVRELSLLSDTEQREIGAFGHAAALEPECVLLHRMFEKIVSQNPTRTALVAADQTLTYEELNQSANRIAHHLIGAGVKERDSVVLLLPRRSFYFAALFGVLKAGASFIPCDPEYPADRIRHIISDSGASFIITTDEHMAEYPAEQVLLMDSLMTGGHTDNPAAEIDGSDLAYMIYTSGSTGKPKGVMLTHRGICSFCTAHPANILYQLVQKEIETMLAVTTVSFDLSLKDTVGILCNGKTVVFASETEMNDPRALTALIEKNSADAVNATPSRYMQYMEYAPFREALKRCKLVMAGGEAFPNTLLDRLQEMELPYIINTYGPTETTISSNMAFLQNADHVSVGRPLLNYTEYIVDLDGNPVPKGVTGELLIGGYGVARGYKNLDKQTAARFTDYRGQRVYRSGDYAKWDSDGNVVILGRADNQVKLRGLRIELGEIEGLIDKQPHIHQAVVVIKKLAGVENLCAYYTAECEIKPEELRQELAKSLTHYMVPTAYLQLDTMPVTPNGKTDLKALPDPVPITAGEYAAPENEGESYFCGLFQKVLKLEKVGANDSFFEIGGTSLLATSVVIEAAEHGYEITYGDIFRRTTPRELAEMFASDEVDEGVRIVDFEDYDYSKINDVLSRNNMQSLCRGEQRPIGNIMLTGATGFMGVHVLAQFLREESGNAYCMIRKGKYDSPKACLKNIFFYYFDSELEEDFDSRVTVLDGDVTDYRKFVPFEELPIDTVFNCAANVKHFSSGTDIEDVNVGGAQNCVKFCKKIGARLIHFSTTSVCGMSVDNKLPAGSVLNEQTLYIGQRLDTKYTNSKLLSERVVLEAVAEQNLDAKVIRVGTLSAREKDGEFQINYLTNNFIGRLRSFEILGCFPYSMINSHVCLSPIDESAKAFLALAKTPRKCCLFNCTNNHSIPLSDIIIQMQKSGMSVKITEDDEFAEALSEAEKNPQKAAILSSMLAYKNMAHGKRFERIRSMNNYTTQALAKMGFFWKQSSERYMLDFIASLSSLDFFDRANLSR